MKSFTDNAGRVWEIAINVDAVKQVRDALDVNLYDVVEGKLIDRLGGDPVLLCDVLFVLCRDQAAKAGVSDREFGRALGGDAIDAATSALLEELIGFFPKAKRRVLGQLLAKTTEFQERAATAVLERLSGPAVERWMEEALSASFGSSPASPASAPAG